MGEGVMDSSTIIGIWSALASTAATVIGVVLAFIVARSDSHIREIAKENDKHKRELISCYRQVGSYYELEAIAYKRIASLTGENETTIQIALRDAVVEMKLERPRITRAYAETRIAQLGS